MPNIQIFTQDNTGMLTAGNEQVVFIPGAVSIAKDYTDAYNVEPDSNNCYYLDKRDATALSLLFKGVIPSTDTDYDKITIDYVTTCLQEGFEVIYKYIDPSAGSVDLKGVFDCLKDKNAYNVKFITSGAYGSVKNVEAIPLKTEDTYTEASVEAGVEIPDTPVYYTKSDDTYNAVTAGGGATFSEGVTYYTKQTVTDYLTAFDFSVANEMLQIAATRVDAVALIDVDNQAFKTLNISATSSDGTAQQPAPTSVNIDILNQELHKFINTVLPENPGEAVQLDTRNSSFGYLLTAQLSLNGNYMPASFMYLYAFMNNGFKKNQPWISIAGVVNGSTASLGSLVEKASKYIIDNILITDGGDISFNSATQVRPYGECIWGDRTLLKADTVKATGYMSIRNLVVDIAKTSYNASIRHTYSSNNDLTWFNYTSMITPLLDRAVQSGVLNNYELQRGYLESDGSPAKLNKIVCKIRCYVNLPVENFDIYVQLENAEVNTEEA